MVELIDVLTPDGAPTGATKPKADAHRDGDWHRAAHVWIVASDGRLLLQRRSLRKENYPGLWDVSAAGHLSAGESARECAVRETFEELGLRLNAGELQFLGTVRESCVLNEGTYIDNEIHDVFIVRRDVDLASLALQDGEVDEVMLVREFPPGMVPHPEEYALLDHAAAARFAISGRPK
ncbi:MAG TPA: NUDIX domain-containing protein [Thermoanaerobaculia bacterium]|nr:NUDIX domain-containing protein [Thermoanaerobaculia bacterium]